MGFENCHHLSSRQLLIGGKHSDFFGTEEVDFGSLINMFVTLLVLVEYAEDE